MKMANYRRISFGADYSGIVFEKDGRIFRGIRPGFEEHIHRQFESGLMTELMERGFIPKTTITDYITDEFPLVLEHQKVPVIIPPSCWSFSMVKDAAILTLHVNQIANKYGYHLIDAHFWNIAFYQGRPIFLDTGSFVPYSAEIVEGFLQEFQRTFLATLTMLNVREVYFARKLLFSSSGFYIRTLPAQTVENTSSYRNAVDIFKKYHRQWHTKNVFKKILHTLNKASKNNPESLCSIISKVFDEHVFEPEYIQMLFSYPPVSTPWTNYQSTFLSDLSDLEKIEQNNQHIRFNKIIDLFFKYAPDAKSSVDLAGNSGMFSYLLSQRKKLAFYLSLDYDENAIEAGYHFLKEHATSVDLAFCNFIQSSSSIIATADCVFALAVTHHLLLVQKIRLDVIFWILQRYSRKYVFVEFMPLGIWDGVHESSPLPDWYTEEFFKEVFCRYFDFIYREQLEPNRIIYIGKIKKV